MPVNPNPPYGLRRIQRQGSADDRDSLTPFRIAAADANSYYEGDPIVRVAGSADAITGRQAATLATAGATQAITGVVCGFVPMYASLATPGPMKRIGAQAVDWVALCSTDPMDEYLVQSNDNGGVPAPSAIVGKNADLAAGAGNNYTGWSGWMLDPSTAADGATHQLTVLGYAQEPDNYIGLASAKLIVRINLSTEIPGAVGV